MWLQRTALGLLLLISQANAATNLTSLVNMFIGTATAANGGSGGNVFPGAFYESSQLNHRHDTPQALLYHMQWLRCVIQTG